MSPFKVHPRHLKGLGLIDKDARHSERRRKFPGMLAKAASGTTIVGSRLPAGKLVASFMCMSNVGHDRTPRLCPGESPPTPLAKARCA
eukprot:1158480-Pelagomonas_calceolata.AAC.4